jgi:LPXTG-motif cell wall-anchored protein
VTQRTRTNLAVWLLGIAIVLNLVLLFTGDTSPGWPLAAVILLGASAALMLSQRRER